jgi:hypothetical protein
MTTSRCTKLETMKDDTLQATNYAELRALRMLHATAA